MPLYEYACRSCEHEFETLVRGNALPSCPSCRSEDLNRRQSVFAARAGATSSIADVPTGGCGHCGDPRGPGACSMN
jgi:putative FmdB family regulatory protein